MGLADALIACQLEYAVAGFFLSQAYAAYLYATLGIIVGFSKAMVPAPRRGVALQSTRMTAAAP